MFWNIIWQDRHSCWSFFSPPICSTWHAPIRGQESHAWLASVFCTWTHHSKTWQLLPPFQHIQWPLCQSIVVMVKLKAAPVALLPLAPQISCLIDSLLSSIMVKSFYLLYRGLCLSTTSISIPSDLFRVKTFVRTLVPEGFSVQCKVPFLRLFCKLIGVLFLHSGNPINSKDAFLILASSVYKDSIRLAAPPRIVCDSRWADTCSIYIDIWNSQTGFWMKSFIVHSLNVGNVVCFFCKASMKIGAPLCTCCYSWGHNC